VTLNLIIYIKNSHKPDCHSEIRTPFKVNALKTRNKACPSTSAKYFTRVLIAHALPCSYSVRLRGAARHNSARFDSTRLGSGGLGWARRSGAMQNTCNQVAKVGFLSR